MPGDDPPASRTARALHLFAAFVAQGAVVLVAHALSRHLRVLPASFRRSAALDAGDTLVLIGLFGAAQVLAAVLARRTHGGPPWRDGPRRAGEAAFALAAASLAGAVAFVATEVPFAANFYALVDGLTVLAWLAGLHAVARARPADVGPRRPWHAALRGPWVAILALAIASPAALALAYKADRDVADALNGLRARIHLAPSPAWALRSAVDASFEQPMQLAFPPGGRAFLVLSRTGLLTRHPWDHPGDGEVLLDLRDEVGSVDSELGALSVALHPRFGAEEGRAFLWITSAGPGGLRVRLLSADLRPATLAARMASRQVLIDQPRRPGGAHNGGTVLFARDGFLLLTVGDLGEKGNGQDRSRALAGGVLRLDVDRIGGAVSAPIARQPEEGSTAGYFVPRRNPWFGEPGVLGEYWAIGLRNPFRASLDPGTGALWVGDVGSVYWEEQDLLRAGDNGGWPLTEGPRELRPAAGPLAGRPVAPRYAYRQTALLRATLAGVVVQADRHPSLRGRYVFADNNASSVHVLDPAAAEPRAELLAVGTTYGQTGITSVVEAPDGRLLFTALGSKERPDGRILELVEADGPTPSPARADRWLTACAGCHGADGRGVGDPRPPDFTSPAWQASATEAAIEDTIRRGGAATGRDPAMPPWDRVLDDEEIAALVARIRSFGR
jgi:glucose/arabinose dehydrogenase